MNDDIEGVLPNAGRVPLADLPTAAGLEDALKRVRERLDKSGTSISGYNGAGGFAGHACRRMETRTCPKSYGGPCGDRPCARLESDDETPWRAEGGP